MKSNTPINIRSDIKNLASFGGGAGLVYQDKYIYHWDLYKVKPKNKKDNKYKMSVKYKNQVGNIIIIYSRLRCLIQCLSDPLVNQLDKGIRKNNKNNIEERKYFSVDKILKYHMI